MLGSAHSPARRLIHSTRLVSLGLWTFTFRANHLKHLYFSTIKKVRRCFIIGLGTRWVKNVVKKLMSVKGALESLSRRFSPTLRF